jgi:hypothetical protein
MLLKRLQSVIGCSSGLSSGHLNSEVGISMFAYDLKIFKTITCLADVALLQGCFDTLSEYCSNYHLKLNVEKCFQISFSRWVACCFPAIYTLSGQPLIKVGSVKDLGVLLDSKLTFNAHIKFCCNKALKMLGFLSRIEPPKKPPRKKFKEICKISFPLKSYFWRYKFNV